MATNVRVEVRAYQGNNNRYDRDRSLVNLLRQFKKAVSEAGVLRTLRDREHYEKPGDRKRRKQRQSDLQRKYESAQGDNLRFRNKERRFDD